MDKFDVLNRKLDLIFEVVMSIKERNEVLEHDRELAGLKHKAEMANNEVHWKEDDKRYLYERIDNFSKRYASIIEECSRLNHEPKIELL